MTSPAPTPDARGAGEERARLLALLRRFGHDATAFQTLEDGLERWWSEDGEACVAYAAVRGAWVAAGGPVCAPERRAQVARSFVDAARARGLRAGLFGVDAALARDAGLVALPIGQQAAWDPSAWSARAAGSRNLRYQLRRARAKGVTVRRVDPAELADPAHPTRRRMARLVATWLATRRMAPMRFLVDVQPFHCAEERRTFLAERGGVLVGFLDAVPVHAREGWFVEDLLRLPTAPNGTAELLVDAAMRQAADEGATWMTLGLAPLAGDVPRWLALTARATRPLYDFRGLVAFKSKLLPVAWEPVQLAHPAEVPAWRALLDVLRAFSGRGLVRFGLRTALEGHPPVLLLLALLLVPWTLLLALVPVDPWFPSAQVQIAWVAFDAVVVVLLLRLARRWSARLGALAAALVTLDALLTWTETLAWNVPRGHGLLEWVLVAVAGLAPTGAAVVLWRAWLRHRRAAGLVERAGA